MLFAYSTAFSNLYGTIELELHHENDGMCFGGNPESKMLQETPMTVPVLNMVFIPH